jgi:Tfp pilus assembly protein PilX
MRRRRSNEIDVLVTAPPARERGSVMIVSMVSLIALLGAGGLAIMSARTGVSATGTDRFSKVALYAAESGIAAATQYLRENRDAAANWSAYVEPNNEDVAPIAGIAGNGAEPDDAANPFSPTMRAWYEVIVLNNTSDPAYAAGDDGDGRVILRATGHGPNGATAVLEVEMQPGSGGNQGVPCPGYAQKNINELGAGHNPCLGTVDADDMDTYRPED